MRAFDLGITHFDLANNYGQPPGNAETVVGKILRDMPRDELIISTKAGYLMWPGPYGDGLSKKYLVASLDQSLKRLGLEYVDIFYAHRPDPLTPLEETMAALDVLVRQGKVLYVGVSNFSGAQFEDAVQVTQRMSVTPITIHQPRYNMLTRDPEYTLFDHTQRAGVGVIVYSPLEQGMLTSKYLSENIPGDSRAAEWWSKGHGWDTRNKVKLDKVRRLNAIAKERGQTLAQMAISWILRLPEVTSVLIGASKVEQIEENVKALHTTVFSENELQAIDEITLGSEGNSTKPPDE
jgi:L-glyceraldehyde 3-phosphate reductase